MTPEEKRVEAIRKAKYSHNAITKAYEDDIDFLLSIIDSLKAAPAPRLVVDAATERDFSEYDDETAQALATSHAAMVECDKAEATPQSVGMCECMSWAGEWRLFTTHHPSCPKYDLIGEVKERISALLVGIESWAADEDGVHDDCWEAYKNARYFIGDFSDKPTVCPVTPPAPAPESVEEVKARLEEMGFEYGHMRDKANGCEYVYARFCKPTWFDQHAATEIEAAQRLLDAVERMK
ncbi:hypothetical protein C4565_03685 [Candidatus Parcubacteria bacterium]|nr:MAG: hypothetical protein C4565_03685 [Candidatus Parcubacteria bacterium]